MTIHQLEQKKLARESIVMVTAYDFATAEAASSAGVDAILVGDSAATTALGLENTRDVTLDEMLFLTRAVRRGCVGPLLIGDLPFGSYEESNELAVETARRFIGAGCDAVKMEGAGDTVARARAVIGAGIPVMGHVGLTPQELRAGVRPVVRGRSASAAMQLLDDARALEQAGCFAIVVEAIPAAVAARIRPFIHVPTIGIGAGAEVDGQVLVMYDLLGLTTGRMPRFAKAYAQLRRAMIDAVSAFAAEVRAQEFPETSHTYTIDDSELRLLDSRLRDAQADIDDGASADDRPARS